MQRASSTEPREAHSPAGELFVADSCNHRVQFSGQTARSFVSLAKQEVNGEVQLPDRARGRAGRQYICGFGSSRLTVLDSEEVLELTDREVRRGNSKIHGASRSIHAAICTWPTRRIIACKS